MSCILEKNPDFRHILVKSCNLSSIWIKVDTNIHHKFWINQFPLVSQQRHVRHDIFAHVSCQGSWPRGAHNKMFSHTSLQDTQFFFLDAPVSGTQPWPWLAGSFTKKGGRDPFDPTQKLGGSARFGFVDGFLLKTPLIVRSDPKRLW